jgi:hypothetical protein
MVEREQLRNDLDAALERPPRVPLGEPVPLGANRPRAVELVNGFGEPEPWGTWTVAGTALLTLRTDAPSGAVELAFEVDAFVVPEHPVLRATVRANGEPVASWSFAYPHEPQWRAFRARTAPASGLVVLELTLETPRAPSELGVSDDVRRLGLALRQLEVRALPYEDAAS